MNHHLKYYCLLLLFSFNIAIIHAQEASIFRSVNTTHGLPSNYVFAVTEDNSGYLWAATDKGLCRYNGAVWEVFDTDKGFPGNYISVMYNDKRNGLWLFITETKSVWWHFNTVTQKLTQVSSPFNIENIFTYPDNNGNLLFYSWGKINKEKNTIERQVYIVYPENPLEYKCIIQSSGNLFYITNIEGKNINVITATNAPYTTTTFHSPEGFSIKNIYLHDSIKITNAAWDYADGILFSWTRKTYIFDSSYQVIYYHPVQHHSPTKYSTYSIDGGRFFAYPTGYFALFKKNGEVVRYPLPKGNESFYINDVYVAKNGTVLLSTMGNGINVLETASKIHIGEPVRTIINHNNSIHLLSGNNLYNIHNNTLRKELSLGINTMCAYMKKDSLITGGLHGLSWYKKTGSNYILTDTSHFTGGISSIIFNKNYWLSTYDVGLLKINAPKQIGYEERISSYPIKVIEKIVPMKNNFACLSYEKGLILHEYNSSIKDYTLITQKNGLLSNAVHYVYERNDTLWICTTHGVSVWNNNKVVQQYSYDKGFKGRIAMYAFHDAAGQLWILSDKYLHILTKDHLYALGSVHITDDETDAITTGLYNADNNTLYIGTQQSLYNISLNNIQPDTVLYAPELSYVNINGNKKSYTNEKIQLSYNYDIAEFYFFPPASSLTRKGKIYYWLNNESVNMQPISDSFTVQFKKLRPGNYNLYAKYINEDGYESKPVLVQSFTVKPPFWLQTWFIVLCGLAGIGIAAAFIVSAQKRKFRKAMAEIEVQQKIQKEKERISRDLHDNVGGQLSFVLFSLDGIHEKEKQKQESISKNVTQSVRSVINSLRETIWAVNDEHIDIRDLYDKLKIYTKSIFKHSDTAIHFHENFTADKKLDSLTGLNLFRICQEIINNSFKYAEAKNILINIVCSKKEIIISIQDDGKGFDINNNSSKGYGLQNMQNRAKEHGFVISCNSIIGKGTEYKITAP